MSIKVGDKVLITTKKGIKFCRGKVVRYEADDGYIGNPESWLRVQLDGLPITFRTFRKSVNDTMWRAKSGNFRGMLNVEVVKS